MKSKFVGLVLALIFVATGLCSSVAAQAKRATAAQDIQTINNPITKGKLGQLRFWAGEFPTLDSKRTGKNIFTVREVRTPLIKLLGQRGFKDLVNTFQVETPIDLIEGFLVLDGCVEHQCIETKTVVAIDLRTGDFYVRSAADLDKKWFTTANKTSALPDCITNMFEQ